MRISAYFTATTSPHRKKKIMTVTHEMHTEHTHEHGATCGHAAVEHADHVDYLHEGHAHHQHNGHWDECVLDVHVPAEDHSGHTHGEGCGHEAVPHGDHVDYVHDGHHHAAHADHVDEH